MQQKTFLLSGEKVSYHESGEGEVIVFLHGWGSSGIAAAFLESAFPDRRIIAPDLPGFGGTPQSEKVDGIYEYAEWLFDFLDVMGIAHADFVAHSFGARIIARAFPMRPEIFGKIVFTGAAGLEEKTMDIKLRVGAAKIAKKVLPESIRKKLLPIVASNEYVSAGNMQDVFKKTVSEDLSSSFAQIDKPTLLLFGQDDKETPVDKGRRLNALIQGSELVVIPNAGHYAFIDQPNRFIMELKKFL